MADETTNNQSPKQQIEAAGKTGAELKNTLEQLKNESKEIDKLLKSQVVGLQQLNTEYKSTQSLTTSLVGVAREDYNTLSKRVTKQKQIVAAENELAERAKNKVTLEKERKNLLRKLDTANKEESSRLRSQVDILNDKLQKEEEYLETGVKSVKVSKDLLETYKKLNESGKFFKGLGDLVKDIPVLRKVFTGIGEAQKKYQDEIYKGASKTKATLIALKGYADDLAKATTGLVVKGFVEADKKSGSLANSLNLSYKEGVALNNEMIEFSLATGESFTTAKRLVQAQTELTKQTGLAAAFSQETNKNFAIVTERYGLSAEGAGNLTKFSAANNQELEDTSASLLGQIEAYKITNGVALDEKAILNDISNLSAATLISMKGQGIAIGSAAAEVRKLGLNFALLEKSAGSLLNFESSIEAELEAELLTGKQLNLERARAAALMNDQETLAKELAKNFGTYTEFSEQNRLAQEAQAKAMGMTRDELAQVLLEQQAITKLGAKDFEEAKAIFEEKKKVLGVEKAMAELGDDNLAKQLNNLSTQEKFNTAVTKLQDALVPVIEGFTGLLEGMNSLVGGANNLGESFKLIAGAGLALMLGKLLRIGKIVRLLGKLIPGMGKGLGKIFSAGKETLANKTSSKGLGKGLTKVLGKTAGKGLLKGAGKLAGKLLPGVGLAFALDAFSRGDITSGLLNTGAGIASFFPGIGTAIAGGLTAIDIGRDVYKATQPETEMAKGGIVSKPTRALIGEAGPEAVVPLDKLYAKFDELIAVAKQGGNVYMDSYKVGETNMIGRSAMA